MPELPEVETTRRGIDPHVTGQRIRDVVVRNPHLRWPVPGDLGQHCAGATLKAIGRRAKYLLLDVERGTVIIHLGMSGRLQVVPYDHSPKAHDHVDLVFENDLALRLTDPRRFGCVLWTDDPANHKLIRQLGPEPLSDAFDGAHLHALARGRRASIKTFIMDAHVVVGVGNIYASEALFHAGIHPLRAAGRVSRARMDRLADTIKQVLAKAIEAGGTTLRDFFGGDGIPGYFSQQLAVYGRAGEACDTCGDTIRQRVIGQRSTFYCLTCQR